MKINQIISSYNIAKLIQKVTVIQSHSQNRTDNDVALFAFGSSTVWYVIWDINFTGQINPKNAKAILGPAQANEIQKEDSSIKYKTSETTLVATGIQNFDLATKLPMIPENRGDRNMQFNKMINNAFYRLDMQSPYGLLLHRPEHLVEPRNNQEYGTLESLKARNITQKIGISTYILDILNLLVHKY